MNHLLKIIFVFLPLSIYCQIDYGFKAGINLNNSSDISKIDQDFVTNITQDSFHGFFIGNYISIEGPLFNLRTELQFSKTKNSNDLIQEKIEVPITFGYKIMPFISAFIGPSFQYILSEKSSSFNLEEVADNTTMGLNLGARIHLGKLQFDLRYERGLSPMETKILNQNNNLAAKIDTRASLLSIGFSYSLDKED